MKKSLLYILIALFNFSYVEAQVGIGTESPNASSILDIESSEEGVLLPRMTTTQRESISAPANGLTVFDTDAQTYYFYNDNESQWEELSTSRLKRSNYQLIQSEDDFPEPSGGKITLDSNTFYEINGLITMQNSIEMNGAYIAGLDLYNDGLIKTSGDLFVGDTSGSMRYLYLSGGSGSAFNITGGLSLIMQNVIVDGFTKVGNFTDIDFAFLYNIQYLNNSDGSTYKNINSLLIGNNGWEGSNSGTLEKFEGTFGLIQKESGFSIANNGAVAIDVSSDPSVANGIITGVVFDGTSSVKINGYTTAPVNLNFTKNWFVQASGIMDEYDDIATGNYYYNGSLTSGFTQSISNNNSVKLNGTTISSDLVRFTSSTNNRLTYEGKRARTFSINASLSVRGTVLDDVFYSFFIRKNGTETLTETNSIFYVDNFQNVSSISITGNVKLNPNDYVEIWCKRLTKSGSSTIVVFSQNLNID